MHIFAITLNSYIQNGKGIRVKRHDAIGDGMVMKKDSLSSIEYSFKIHKKGGYTSGTEHFWKTIKNVESAHAELEEPATAAEHDISKSNRQLCPDEMCRSRFLTDSGLEAHLTSGRHSYFKFTETITDFGEEFV